MYATHRVIRGAPANISGGISPKTGLAKVSGVPQLFVALSGGQRANVSGRYPNPSSLSAAEALRGNA